MYLLQTEPNLQAERLPIVAHGGAVDPFPITRIALPESRALLN